MPGLHQFGEWPLRDLHASIDWTPFFRAWELAGNYPAILDDPVVGESARSLFEDAQAMLDQIIAERWVTPKATVGLWRCKREGDDVLVLAGNDWTRVPFLRQQVKKREGRPNMCLADFINPEGEDWIGGFAVGIHGLEPHLERFKAENDDYSDILLKALADRLAESFAEVLHAEVRNRLWGYADEHFSNEQLIREKYQGIRPAPGYPACPDHSLKPVLFELLGGNPGGVTLTENFAMLPTSAVSGFYFGHRDSQYFGVARIGQDQLRDYAARRGIDVDGRRTLAAAQSRLGNREAVALSGCSAACSSSSRCCSLQRWPRRAASTRSLSPKVQLHQGARSSWRSICTPSPGGMAIGSIRAMPGCRWTSQWQLPPGLHGRGRCAIQCRRG